jgi:hypothetical protein
VNFAGWTYAWKAVADEEVKEENTEPTGPTIIETGVAIVAVVGVTVGVAIAKGIVKGIGSFFSSKGSPATGAAGPVTENTLKKYTKGTLADGRAIIDPGLNGSGDLGKTDSTGHVRISPDAFASKGLLSSTIEHESVHVRQIKEGRFHAFKNTPADLVNELEAYRDGLRKADTFKGDKILDQYRQQWRVKINDLTGGLVGTPYRERVVRVPPDYSLEILDTCPTSVCHL